MDPTERARFLFVQPQIDPTAYVAAQAVIIGDVRLAARSSVWPTAVLRGDINYIEIGEGSNIQDGAIVHLADDIPTIVGKLVTVGHRAILHACTVEDECLIGMGATILDEAVIGKGSIIGAHALVTKGMRIPPGSSWARPRKWCARFTPRKSPTSATGPTITSSWPRSIKCILRRALRSRNCSEVDLPRPNGMLLAKRISNAFLS